MPDRTDATPSAEPAAPTRRFRRRIVHRRAADRTLRQRVRDRVEAAGLTALIGLCRLLGVDAASALFGVVWRTLGPRNRRHARALRNLAVAFPGMAPDRREAIARENWENLGRTMAEGFLLDRILADPSRIDDRTQDLLAGRGDKGVVACSAHYGNWELAVVPLLAAGLAPAGLYQAPRNPIVDAILTRRRAALYPGGLWSKTPDTPRRLMARVRAGHAIAIVSDLREARGIDVPFFGRPSRSTAFPALVARATAAPMVAGRVIRLKGARFRIEGEAIAVPRTADRDADVHAATAALHATFERWIREEPGQWMWGMGRWR